MKNVITAFGTILLLMLNVFGCMAISNASMMVATAKEYKADVIAEIENSNFNPDVIAACVAQAQATGYQLQVVNSVYDAEHDIQSAEVILTYSYKIPLFGIVETKSTRGIAR